MSYLTSADLTGVIGWMETVTWTIHSALKYTIYLKTWKAYIGLLSAIKWDKNPNMKTAANVCLPAHTGQHSPGTLMKLMQGDRQRTSEQVVTPSTHIHVMQGVESANQLLPSVCSSPPYTQPERENSITGKSISSCDDNFRWSVYLYSEGSRFLDQSPDAYKAAWNTQETHTAPHLPAKLREI